MITPHLSETLFTLYAALNCAGYDDENAPDGMHMVRSAVRQALRKSAPDRVAFVGNTIQTPGLLYLNHWAMWHSAPPDFNPLGPTRNQMAGFGEGLRDFWNTCSIHALWLAQTGAYAGEIVSLEQSAAQACGRLSAFLGHDVLPLLGKVTLVPNLLESYNRAYTISAVDGKAIICGPFFTPRNYAKIFSDLRGFQVSHELLHVALSALTPNPMDAILHECENPPAGCLPLSGAYTSWPVFIEECLVRAVNVHLWMTDNPEHAKQMIEEDARNGLNLAGAIHKNLAVQPINSSTPSRLIAAAVQGIHDRAAKTAAPDF